jgi:hypothetical protein
MLPISKNILATIILAASITGCTGEKDELPSTAGQNVRTPQPVRQNTEVSPPLKGTSPTASPPASKKSDLDYSKPIYTTRYAIICRQTLIFAAALDHRVGHGLEDIDDMFRSIWSQNAKVKTLGCEEWRSGIRVYARPMESFRPYTSVSLSPDSDWIYFTHSSHLTNGFEDVPAEPKVSVEDIHKKGLEAYNKQNYEDALKFWKKSAGEGYTSSEYDLGLLYSTGDGGVPQDVVQAMMWYRRAAGKGLPAAQYGIGLLYEAMMDAEQARSWYNLAAGQGDAMAAKGLARLDAAADISGTSSTTPSQ